MAYQNLPAQRRLLDAIAAGESGGYDMMYGGGKFGSYADHPRQAIPIQSGPNAGKTSSAAGRYQFLGSTWDEVSKEFGLKDFSPESQDAGAWNWAAKIYTSKTGRDLLADLEAGRTQDIAPALASVWTSIPGGIEPNKATAGFDARLGSQPVATPSGGLLAEAAMPAQQSGIGGLLARLAQQPQQPSRPEEAMQVAPQRQEEPEPAFRNLLAQRRIDPRMLRVATPRGGLLGGLG